jgi:hypothetical protein
MARQGLKLISALEAEGRAHQHLVNIGEELKTVYMAGEQPDEDEMLRLHQAYDELLAAAHVCGRVRRAGNGHPQAPRSLAR